mmetsp:Transcript_7830/g.20612  ORF Transcript_7830/g.20612 Transcript_7830/m.20612 type:complete len:146 (+) Transcript_7830:2-439(+)
MLAQEWASSEEPNANKGNVDTFMRMMLPEEQRAGARGDRLMRQFKTAFLETNRPAAGLQGQLAAMGRFNSTKQLGSIACPTFVVSGDMDEVMPFANSQSLASRIPGATLQAWANAGHFWWATRPLEAIDLVANFMRKYDTPRPSL